jgi:hypothetical protein
MDAQNIINPRLFELHPNKLNVKQVQMTAKSVVYSIIFEIINPVSYR